MYLVLFLPSFPETNPRKKNPDRHHKASSKPWFEQINKKVTDIEVVDENPYLFLPFLSVYLVIDMVLRLKNYILILTYNLTARVAEKNSVSWDGFNI